MENSAVVTIAVALLSSTGLSALVTGLFARSREKRRQHDGVQAGVRMLLYDRIKHLGTKYLADGYVKPDALEDLIAMHKIYQDELGGNGFLDKIMKDVRALPPVVKKRD